MLSAGFTAGFTLVSWGVVTWVQNRPFTLLFAGGVAPARQLLVGLSAGLVVSVLTTWIGLKAPVLERLRGAIRAILSRVRPRGWDLVFVSVGAGWGEELFFRGVLQGYLGIWWTALLFALLHGFVVWGRWSGALLTAYVFAAGVGLGYLCEQAGLAAAMWAHALYDWVTLCGYVRYWKKSAPV